MLDKGMKPCLNTSLALFNGIACFESLENSKEFYEQVKPKGVLPDAGEGTEGRFTELMKSFQSYADLEKRTIDKDIQEVISEFSEEGFGKHAAKIFCAMVEDGNVSEAMDLFQSTPETRINPMGLAVDADFFGDAKKYLIEMLDKGMHPNAGTYTAVLEGFGRQENKKAEEEGKEFLEVMMAKGFVPDTEAVREVLKGRPTPVISRVMSIILSKFQ
ncbi:hypothetical protein ACLB2K_068904 [Fragaria x ananassa]